MPRKQSASGKRSIPVSPLLERSPQQTRGKGEAMRLKSAAHSKDHAPVPGSCSAALEQASKPHRQMLLATGNCALEGLMPSYHTAKYCQARHHHGCSLFCQCKRL